MRSWGGADHGPGGGRRAAGGLRCGAYLWQLVDACHILQQAELPFIATSTRIWCAQTRWALCRTAVPSARCWRTPQAGKPRYVESPVLLW